MTVEKTLNLLLNYKELIEFIPPVVTSVVWLVIKILQYFRASSYSYFYKVPMELFDKVDLMRTIGNIIIIFGMSFIFYFPFITLNLDWIDRKHVIMVFVLSFTIPYGAIILSVLAKQLSWKCTDKWKVFYILILDAVISICITLFVNYIFNKECPCAPMHLSIIYEGFAISYVLACIWMLLKANPTIDNRKEFSIIDKDEIKKLPIEIGKNSVLLVVDYLRDDKMIVKECVDKGESLKLKSKFWVIDSAEVGIRIKKFAKGVEL